MKSEKEEKEELENFMANYGIQVIFKNDEKLKENKKQTKPAIEKKIS